MTSPGGGPFIRLEAFDRPPGGVAGAVIGMFGEWQNQVEVGGRAALAEGGDGGDAELEVGTGVGGDAAGSGEGVGVAEEDGDLEGGDFVGVGVAAAVEDGGGTLDQLVVGDFRRLADAVEAEEAGGGEGDGGIGAVAAEGGDDLGPEAGSGNLLLVGERKLLETVLAPEDIGGFVGDDGEEDAGGFDRGGRALEEAVGEVVLADDQEFVLGVVEALCEEGEAGFDVGGGERLGEGVEGAAGIAMPTGCVEEGLHGAGGEWKGKWE